MPRQDVLPVVAPFASRYESPFARPVAAITALVAGALRRARQPVEIRDLEAAHGRAADHHELERLQSAWDRRDGGGVRDWR